MADGEILMKLQNKPLYVKFTTRKNNQYMYDVCTNKVVYAPDPMPEILELYPMKSKDDIVSFLSKSYAENLCKDYYNQIDKFVKNDKMFLCYDENPPKFSYSKDDFWEKCYSQNMYSMTLNVTEDCNFRCSYCAYSGSYNKQRIHKKKNMSFEIAKLSIDYFLTKISDLNKIKQIPLVKAIGFYGGEPLLCYKLIKNCIEYVKKNYSHENVSFVITTNGTLLQKKL